MRWASRLHAWLSVAVLVSAGVIGFLALLAPPASASHWCSPLVVSLSPGSGYAGDATPLSITLTNGIADALSVSDLQVKLSWESTSSSWGTMSLAGYANDTNTVTKTLPTTPGDYTASVTVTGKAVGDLFSTGCGPFTEPLRVDPVPPPPTVTATANPTAGTAPLAVNLTATVNYGLAPFTYAWTFGDGASGSGKSAGHTYASQGTYTVTVVVTDSRGRSATDTVTVTVSEPSKGALDFLFVSVLGIPLWTIIVLLVVLAVIVGILKWGRKPPAQAP